MSVETSVHILTLIHVNQNTYMQIQTDLFHKQQNRKEKKNTTYISPGTLISFSSFFSQKYKHEGLVSNASKLAWA